MGIFDIFKKKPIESKSATPNPGSDSGQRSLASFLQQTDNWDLSFAVLIEYFKKCAPFGDSVLTIIDSFAEIRPIVVDILTGEKVEHDILMLLEYPNDSMSGTDYRKHLGGMTLITGNPLLKAIGNVKKPPLALDVTSPVYTDVQPDAAGDIGTIKVMSQFENAVYRAFNVEGRARYRANEENELWPIFGFNPDRGSREFYGTPIAQPLYYDIEQYVSSGQHNNSLLKRGARPGGSFMSKFQTPLTDEQFKRFQDQIDLYYVGANNAGRPLFLENVEYSEHIVNNKDMDYKTLSANTKTAIYRQFNIPLPLVESSSMTYSNYETAQVALYDNAVLPLTNYLYEQIGLALFYRYGSDWRRYRLTYDPTSISALQMRRTEEIKTKKQVAVHTINELRQDFGDEPLDGGDVLLRPANEIPALEADEDLDDIGNPNDNE